MRGSGIYNDFASGNSSACCSSWRNFMNNPRVWAAALFAATVLVAGLASTTGARPQVADGIIQGIVADAETGTPLQDVRVQLRGAAFFTATTGVNGAFTLEGLSAGRYRLTTVSGTHAPVRNPQQKL